jgi:hypothetical protein
MAICYHKSIANEGVANSGWPHNGPSRSSVGQQSSAKLTRLDSTILTRRRASKSKRKEEGGLIETASKELGFAT